MNREALLYEKLENKFVRCFLCSHYCRISDGAFGICGVRQNSGGILYTRVYGSPIAENADPIEKKPLYHFLPGSKSYSLATIGCNFRCGFCQNWRISQAKPADGAVSAPADEVSPDRVVWRAMETACASISYTYTEPTIFFEYAMDIARVASAKGLSNVFVTNGYMTKECLEAAKPYLDAANVDLKFFKDESYAKVCGGRLAPVLETIKSMRSMGIWLEITTLVIPGMNDSDDELRAIAEFIAGVGKDIPWHVSRFHPDYVFTGYDVTPAATLKKAVRLGEDAGLQFVYAGNVAGWGNDTSCPACHKALIRREGFSARENHVSSGRCAFCRGMVAGVFA